MNSTIDHCTGIAGVMCSTPARTWVYFRPYFHYYLSNVHNWDAMIASVFFR